MRVRPVVLLSMFLLLAVSLEPVLPMFAQAPADHDLPASFGAHFYSQTDGRNGATGTGYAVSNADGIPFWNFFRTYGGVQAVGYPVSHRFVWDGYTVQAFQKVVFQWRPEAGTVYFVNVLDQLHEAGFNPYLRAARQVPPQSDWQSDAGLAFPQIVARHLALLDAHPAIAAAFYAEPDPFNRNGLPMASVQEFGNVVVLRAQRKVYQQWLVDMPWAKAGQVITANGGDLGKDAGLYPALAIQPFSASSVPLSAVSSFGTSPMQFPTVAAATTTSTSSPTSTPSPTPSPTNTPSLGRCFGDEQIAFEPNFPSTGQSFTIGVTSARGSSDVGLHGPGNPVFGGGRFGGKGTIWVWTATVHEPGRYEYDFTIGNTICAATTVLVGTSAVTATPTPTFTNYGACAGDEEISFDPSLPAIGQRFTIAVTSARPSTNVSLTGPWGPSFDGVRDGGKGKVWSWSAVSYEPGRFTYNFLVNGATCDNATVQIGIGR